jgi:lipopolysaccharide transport system permease protein
VVANPNYVKKVIFPLEILPVVALATALFQGCLSFLILLAGLVLFVGWPSWTILLFPLVVLPLCLLTLGLGWMLAALGVFIRDIGQFIVIILQMLLFASPIFYDLNQVPEQFRWILRLNPMTEIVTDGRRTVMWGLTPDWGGWALVAVVTLVVVQAGYMVFMRSKRAFGDVL